MEESNNNSQTEQFNLHIVRHRFFIPLYSKKYPNSVYCKKIADFITKYKPYKVECIVKDMYKYGFYITYA